MKKLKAIWIVFRYDIGIWFAGLITNWLPDNRITIKLRGFLFKPFIYKCGKGFTLAKNVQLKSTNKLVIGNDVYLASGVWLNAMGGMTIGDKVVMGPYVVVSTGTHQFKNGSARFGGSVFEPVTIGRGTWLASHVVIRAGVKIGAGVLAAAHAAITKDVPDNVIVGGVPAKVIGPRTDSDKQVQYSRFD
ncbi:MAG: acyltransferase [Planctomycetota bacterium]|jgi:acetyltransferase-like isoleucine patch superfamily enzyme